MICVGGAGSSACYADSGGPLVCEQRGRWVLYGSTSFGVSEVCAGDKYSVYVRVSNYIKWMEHIIGKKSNLYFEGNMRVYINLVGFGRRWSGYEMYYMHNGVLPETITLLFSIFSLVKIWKSTFGFVSCYGAPSWIVTKLLLIATLHVSEAVSKIRREPLIRDVCIWNRTQTYKWYSSRPI